MSFSFFPSNTAAPDIDNHDLLPIGADRHDSSDEARQAHLQGISSYLMSEHDEGARQRVTDTLGRVPDVADTKSRNYWAGRAYAKANGFYGNPENYWRAQNMKLPYAEKKGDMYELIGAELAQKTHTHHLQLKQQEKEYEAFEARNADTLSKLLAGHDYEEFYGEGGGISSIDMQQLGEQMDSSVMDHVAALPWKQKAPMSRNPLLDMTAEAEGVNMQKVLRINAVMKQVRKAAQLTEDGDFKAHDALRRVGDKIGTLVANIAEIDKDGNYHIPEEDLAYIHRGLMTIAEEIKERDVVDSLDNFNLAFMSTFDDIAAFLVNFEASSGNDRISQEALDAQEAAHLKSWQLFEYGENNPAFIDGHVIRTPDEYVQRYMQRFYDQNARVTRNELARKQHTAIRQLQGAFQAYAQVAASSADHLAWYKKVTKGAAAMAGDSALYLLPIVGQSVGTAGAIASGYERNMNSNYFEGLRGSEALVRSWQDDNIQALVELLPWSRVGGAGLNKWAGKMLNKGKVGTLTRSIAKFSSRGGLRAYALEVGGMFIDEGLIEPLSGGILTLTSDAALDALGIAHGESRSFSEAFEDITELYEDPAQAGALGLFSAVLNGARLPALLSQSRHFATLSDTWERVGLSKAQAQRVIESENPLDAGQKLWQEEMAKDPTAVRERMRKKSKQQPEEGSILLATGQMQGAEGDANRIRQETWREMQQRGFVPQVEALGERDGEEHFRITELSPNGEQVLATHEFNAKKADDYLAARITMAEQRHFAGQQNVIYGAMSDHASQIVGEAMAQAAENTDGKKGITIENLNELPEGIGEHVQRDGMLTIKSIKLAAEKLGGKWKSVFSSFAERQSIAEQQGASATGSAVLRMREASPYNTRGIHGSTIHVARGSARAHEVLEDTIESFADMDLQERALRLTDEQSLTPEEAMKAAFSEQVAMVRATRDSLMRIDSSLKLPELPEDASYMQLIETLSQMGVSQMLTTGLLPKELDPITDMIKGAVDLSAQSVKLARAWKKAKDQGLDGLPEMSDYFDQLGMDVRDTFTRARIDERVLEAVRKSRPIIQGQQQLMGVDVPTVEQIREEQAAAQARDDEEEAFEDKHRIEASPQQVQQAHTSDVEQQLTHTSSRASAAVHGVFVDNAAAYNKAGGYWMGCIPVKQLSDSKDVQQVKAGAKGKHGVINPITGDYQQDTEAIYVWKRKDGRLEVISGRHKYDLALRTDTEAVTCYVYLESSKHDAKWARLLDFENNMRGDQADELTAAIYTRETGYTDQQLQRKGLMRNKSKSKRGILIGREAREELWTRFKNGVISPMDAEIIVQMTKNLRNAERIEDIQAKCVHLLDQKKSWDYISAMVQLMASKESVFMKQGLLDLGADFEADMEKAAAYIEKSVQGLNEAITIIKQGKKLSGKKKELAQRLGLSTTSQTETEQKLDDLTLMKEMFASVGSYPELIAAAQMWDGKAELDPVGYALSYATKARERANAEKELSREDWEQSQVDYSGMGEFSFSTRRTLDELGLKPSDVVRPQRYASTREEAKEILFGVRGTMFRRREGSKKDSDLVPIQGRGVIAKDTDFEAFVTSKTIRKATSAEAIKKTLRSTSADYHFIAAANIDYLWGQSFAFTIKPDKRGKANIKGVHQRIAYILINQDLCQVKLTAKEFHNEKDINHLYSVEIENVEKINELDVKAKRFDSQENNPHTHNQAQGDDSTLSPDVKPTSSTDVNFTASVRNWKARQIQEVLSSEEGQKLDAYIKSIPENGDTSSMPDLILRTLDSDEAQDLSSLLGVDLTGAQIIISSSSIIHALRKHGNDSQTEELQRDLTMDDILLLPLIIRNKDSVETSGKKKIHFFKNLDDGRIHQVYFVLERSKNKPPRLKLKTAWAEALRSGITPEMESLNDRGLNAQHSGSIVTNIHHGVKKIYPENFSSFSMRTFSESAMAARAVFAERADEKESIQLLKRYDLLIDTLQESLAASNRDETLGTGAQRYAAIISLLEATKGVLPEKYTRMGKLNGLLKWAAVYAQMIETGEIPRTGSGVLKGHIAEKFVQSMKNKKNDMLLQGLSESEAREAMATLAAERIETSLLKVANAARARVDMFLKDRAWERVELTAERAYPKKEKGRKSPRGKLDSAGYHQMEYALSVMRMDSNAIAEEMAGLRGRIAELIPDSEDYAARKDELEEQLNQVSVFGCWSRMSAPQAQAAAEAFVALVMQRKTLWEQQLEKRVLHRHYVMNQLKARFKVDNNANNRSEGKRSYNPLKTLKRVGKETGYGLMNYNQLLLSSKHVFGEQFTRERIQEMVDATQSLNIANTENETFFAQSVSEATGIDLSEENALIDWLNDFGKVQNTGIKKQEFITYTIKLPIDEARAWVALSKEERAAKREKLTKDATEQELATRNIPSERDIWMMEQDLKEHDLKAAEGKSMSKRKWVEVRGRHKSGNTVELIASKDAVANALLLFEQEDYEHLIEHEGFTPIDAQGNIIDRSTDRETPIDPQRTLQPLYDYVGVEALSLAHKLRRKVSENFEGVAKKYAEERGINIAQKPKYWRGNFNLNIMLEKDTLTQLNASAGAGYGFLIDRVKHHSAIEWTNTMSAVFLRSIKDQNNYLYTSHITNDWRAMLMDTSFSRGIELELGKEYLDTLKSWINIIDGASMADELANKWTQNILGAMMRGVANAALSGNGWVLAKQSSAILHGMLGGEVPRDVIEGREGIRELEYRHIGMGEFAAAMARSKAGQSKISLKEIGESKAFLARLDSKYKRIAQRMTLKDGQRQHRYMMRYTDASMDAIDYVDRKFNVLSMHALADAIYHNLEKQKKEKNLNWTHEEMVQAALDSVGRAISLSAQPKRIIDKSLFAARGGLITNIMLMFKSEIINKLGLTISRMMSGEIYSATSLHLLYGISTAFIATAIGWIRYGDSDDDEDKALWKEALSFGVKIGTGDLSATPIIGDGIKSITSRLTGEWNSARPLHEMFIDPIGIYQKSARLISGKKQGRDMTAHDYLSTTQGLIRAFGAASGIFLNNKGGSTAATILDLATASNQARTLSDFIKKLRELTE